jgi:predicted house-cleaning noncanonical NTP pyrophosphatase (MazG superfamily)
MLRIMVPPTSYKFATDSVNELSKLSTVISKLKTKYNFSDQEVEEFRNNWVAVQGR